MLLRKSFKSSIQTGVKDVVKRYNSFMDRQLTTDEQSSCQDENLEARMVAETQCYQDESTKPADGTGNRLPGQ